jgi:hypothetical protein
MNAMVKKKKKLKPLTPHVIGVYPKQVVHMSVPYGTAKGGAPYLAAVRHMHNLARSISQNY